MSAVSVFASTSGVRIQVATAVRMTTPSVIAVFWTTESIVIGPVVGRRGRVAGAARVPTDAPGRGVARSRSATVVRLPPRCELLGPAEHRVVALHGLSSEAVGDVSLTGHLYEPSLGGLTDVQRHPAGRFPFSRAFGRRTVTSRDESAATSRWRADRDTT